MSLMIIWPEVKRNYFANETTLKFCESLYVQGELIFRTNSCKWYEFKLTLSSDGKHAGLKQNK